MRRLLLLLALLGWASAADTAGVLPEELLGAPGERAEAAPRPALEALLAPWRPLAAQAGARDGEALTGRGPLAPLAARRVLAAPASGARLAVLDAEGDGAPDLVTITRRADGGFLHEVRPGLPGGGFAPVPAWSALTHGGHWLSGGFLPLSPRGLPGRLDLEQRPFGLLGLRAATRLAYVPCGAGGCAGDPAFRLAAKGALPLPAGVRDADGDGRPDLLLLDAMAPSLSLGGLAADLAAGRAWLELRLHLQRPDGGFAETPDARLRLPLELGGPARVSWRETPSGGAPFLLLGDPAAPAAVLRWEGGGLRRLGPGAE